MEHLQLLLAFLCFFIYLPTCYSQDKETKSTGLYENAGFSCKSQQSMRLDRRLHGKPQLGDPPLELVVVDENGISTNEYSPGKVYKVRLLGFVSFRGLILQPRLCTRSGLLLGALRGGQFIKEDDKWKSFGIDYQNCNNHETNDSIVHANDDRKFEVDVMWKTNQNVGAVQFLITFVKENTEFWERFAPKTALLMPMKKVKEGSSNTEVPELNGIIPPTTIPPIEALSKSIKIKKEKEIPTTTKSSEISISSTEQHTTVETPSTSSEPASTDSTEKSTTLLEKESVSPTRTTASNTIMSEKPLESTTSPPFDSSPMTSTDTAEETTEQTLETNEQVSSSTSLPSSSDSTSSIAESKTVMMENKKNNKEDKTSEEDSIASLPFDSSLFDEVNEISTVPPSSIIITTTPSILTSESIIVPIVKEKVIKHSVATEDQIVNDATSRVFKKYVPDEQTGLHTDDVHFLNSHAHLRHDFVSEMDPEEQCRQANPCENDGQCIVDDGKIKCECKRGFIGSFCNVTDACINHGCQDSSYCVNDMKGSYTCKCKRGFVGSYCQYQCSPEQCLNGGECIMKKDREIGCQCAPGFSGNNCERDINECNYNHCKNGANCTDLVNDYKCHCSAGWMGKNCDRACQDVYGSCKVWKREGQCEIMRSSTQFFDINCAASCDQCEFDNSTLTTTTPLPPILVPLAWLLGEWQTHQRGYHNRTLDFPLDMEQAPGYNETITFSVAEALMFGTPSINFTSRSIADNNPENIHETNGFITIRQYAPKGEENITRAALMTVSNMGITMIEEGDVLTTRTTMGHHVHLAANYLLAPMESKKKLSKKQFRSFVRKGNRLMQLMTREEHDGRITKHSKTYVRTKEFIYM